jgi:Cu-Zn family superoxide dismutase
MMQRRFHRAAIALAASAVLTAACGDADEERAAGGQSASPVTATADLRDASGQTVASARLSDATRGVLVHLTISKAPAGVRAFHVHETGRCNAPDFESAGAHFNPSKAQHGLFNDQGPHTGDLPNLHVGPGRSELEILVVGATLGGGPMTLLDGDGAALVLHGAADDYRTDPAGNAGPRIACGVITR